MSSRKDTEGMLCKPFFSTENAVHFRIEICIDEEEILCSLTSCEKELIVKAKKNLKAKALKYNIDLARRDFLRAFLKNVKRECSLKVPVDYYITINLLSPISFRDGVVKIITKALSNYFLKFV